MIISFSTGKVETKGGSGLLQQKRVEVTGNGLDVVVPDAGYDGLSTVYIKTDVGDGGGSYKDFSVIGYDDATSIMLNNEIDDNIAYSKSLYDAWNPENTGAVELYYEDTALVYAPQIDTSNVISTHMMYYGCENLKYVPLLDTSKVTEASMMFSGCHNLTFIPDFDFSNVTNMSYLFQGTKITESPKIITSSNAKFNYMFQSCAELTTVHPIDTSKATNMVGLFSGCRNLVTAPVISLKSMSNTPFGYNANAYNLFSNCSSLKVFGGFIDCEHITDWGSTSYNVFYSPTHMENIEQFGTIKGANFNVSKCSKLTVDSLMVILNALYDYIGNGVTVPSTAKATLGSTNLAKLTDEQKAIATDKGWILS